MSDIEVIHGDCRLILPTLEGIGAVVMDPPYGIGHSSSYGASWKDTEILNDRNTEVRDQIIAWAEQQSIPWACFGNWKCQRPPQARGVLVWDKGPAFGMGDLSFPWKMSWEEIYIGGPDWKGVRDEGVLRGHYITPFENLGRKHPHQKPVSLITHLFSKLPRDAVVLDPCAGSGSILVACLKSGRRGIGIELDAKWIPVINRRVADARATLFDAVGL